MSAPRLDIDLDKVEHNTRVLVDRLAPVGIAVTGITKATLGSPGVGAAMLRGGVAGLGDARVPNLARLAGLAGSTSRMLIRSPMLSQVGLVVTAADLSLNTEPVVLRALNTAAAELGRTHDVVLMVELGDLREGIAIADVAAAARLVGSLGSLRLRGLGANLACQSGVLPDDTNMGVLGLLVERVESTLDITLDVVSAGNSANLDWALSTSHLGRTNQLRVGEAILLGTEPLGRTAISGLHTDAFTLTAEVIEVSDKPAQPWGSLAQATFGVAALRAGVGTIRQAIVALGRQDVDLVGLVPPAGITVLGMGSDHLILDVGDHSIAVGEEISFGLGYSSLVRAMTSPFVTKTERTAKHGLLAG